MKLCCCGFNFESSVASLAQGHFGSRAGSDQSAGLGWLRRSLPKNKPRTLSSFYPEYEVLEHEGAQSRRAMLQKILSEVSAALGGS